jgi:hypothetical protein
MAVDFSQALNAMKRGGKVRRVVWSETRWIEIRDDPLPFICMTNLQGGILPWGALHDDLLAEDWDVQAGIEIK